MRITSLILKQIREGDTQIMYKYWENIFVNKQSLPTQRIELINVEKIIKKYFNKEIDLQTLCDWEWMILLSNSYRIGKKNQSDVKKLLWLIGNVDLPKTSEENFEKMKQALGISREAEK